MNTQDQKVTKIRDIAPTAVRLSPNLRAALAREAGINGRSLHAEILMRLTHSLETPQNPYTEPTTPTSAVTVGEKAPREPIHNNDSERALLASFRKLPLEKQLSLITLLR